MAMDMSSLTSALARRKEDGTGCEEVIAAVKELLSQHEANSTLFNSQLVTALHETTLRHELNRHILRFPCEKVR